MNFMAFVRIAEMLENGGYVLSVSSTVVGGCWEWLDRSAMIREVT